jgi:hypothetical protein
VQSWEEVVVHVSDLKESWLLILDNADDLLTDYQRCMSTSPSGTIIMTTRNDQCHQYATATAIKLQGLPSDVARDLLLKALGTPIHQWSTFSQAADDVVSLLHSHLLALLQAAAYMRRGHCRLEQYPAEYERQRQSLMKFRSNQMQSRYKDVYATFEASAMALKRMAEDDATADEAADALELLSLLPFGSPSGFSLSFFELSWHQAQNIPSDMNDDYTIDVCNDILTPWHIRHLPQFLQRPLESWSAHRLIEAVYLLKSFAIISVHSSGSETHVSAHPLVYAWALDRQNVAEQCKSWLALGCTLAFVTKFRHQDVDHNQLQAHVDSLVRHDLSLVFDSSPAQLVASFLICCGWFLIMARYDSVLETVL